MSQNKIKNDFTVSFNRIKKLKRKNIIFQSIGILVLLSMIFVNYKSLFIFNFLFIIISSIITLSVIRLSKKIILIKFNVQKNKLIMVTFSKKESELDFNKVNFSNNKKGIILLDLKDNLLIQINENEWDNYPILLKLLQENSKKKDLPKSTIKGLFKEIIKNEIKDPSGLY